MYIVQLTKPLQAFGPSSYKHRYNIFWWNILSLNISLNIQEHPVQ
jgi:hypothetical protein